MARKSSATTEAEGGRWYSATAGRCTPTLERAGQGNVEKETMTITDALAVPVADLHGMARDIQSA